jgi:hypothetical protein
LQRTYEEKKNFFHLLFCVFLRRVYSVLNYKQKKIISIQFFKNVCIIFFPSKTTATLAQTTIAIANGVSPAENLQAMRDYAAEQVKLINEQQ